MRLTSNLQDELKATIDNKEEEMSPEMNTSIYKMVESPGPRLSKKPEIFIKKRLNIEREPSK